MAELGGIGTGVVEEGTCKDRGGGSSYHLGRGCGSLVGSDAGSNRVVGFGRGKLVELIDEAGLSLEGLLS